MNAHTIPKQLKMTITKIKITRKHKEIVSKINQFIQETDRILLNIRKSMMMTFKKYYREHRHPTTHKIIPSQLISVQKIKLFLKTNEW